MPPPRDSFGQALTALRRRLRQGLDAPGAALPIQLIAQDLRLSPTPVREALSRLAGEGLVDKRGPAYTRPRHDAVALVELYRLRTLYLGAALAGDVDRRVRRRVLPPDEPASFSARLTENPDAHAEVIEALFAQIVRHADDRMLAQAFQNAAERLAPFHVQEAILLDDPTGEANALIAAFEAGDGPSLRAGVRLHHRRRSAAAEAIVRLASGAKYRTDIV